MKLGYFKDALRIIQGYYKDASRMMFQWIFKNTRMIIWGYTDDYLSIINSMLKVLLKLKGYLTLIPIVLTVNGHM